MLRLVMEQKAKVSKVHWSDRLPLKNIPQLDSIGFWKLVLTIQSGSLVLHCEHFKGSAGGVVRGPSGPKLLAEHGERAKGAGDEEDLGVLQLQLAGQNYPWQAHDNQCHNNCQHHFHRSMQWLIIIRSTPRTPRLQLMAWASSQFRRRRQILMWNWPCQPNTLSIYSTLQHLIAYNYSALCTAVN